MAELNTAVAVTATRSCDTVERTIREIWSEYFDHPVSPYDNFFDLGGDSLAMIDVVGRARAAGLSVRSSVALRNPSPARLAETLTVHADTPPVTIQALTAPEAALRAPAWPTPGTVLEPIVPGDGTPLYAVHSDSHVQAERDAIASWDSPRPVIGLPLPGTRGLIPPFGTVGEIAEAFLSALGEPTGPCRLAGFGDGAVVALEMARLLANRGARVALLALVKPPVLGAATEDGADRMTGLARRFGLDGAESLDEIHTRLRRNGWYDERVRPADLPRLHQLHADLTHAVRGYRPGRHDGPAVLVHDLAEPEVARTWSEAVPGLETHAFDHGIESPLAVLRDGRLAAVMRRALES